MEPKQIRGIGEEEPEVDPQGIPATVELEPVKEIDGDFSWEHQMFQDLDLGWEALSTGAEKMAIAQFLGVIAESVTRIAVKLNEPPAD